MKKFSAFLFVSLLLASLLAACSWSPTGNTTVTTPPVIGIVIETATPNTAAPTTTAQPPTVIPTRTVLDPIQHPDLAQRFCAGNEGRTIHITEGQMLCPANLVTFATQVANGQTSASGLASSTAIGTTTTSGQSASWTLEIFNGATPQMLAWQWRDLNPSLWPVFPNVDNVNAGFLAANGLEYGEDESGYCEQQELCDVVVPAMHYRVITGDYSLGFDTCTAQNGQGCGIILVNVGNVSASFEDVSVDFGFTVWGRYWNGDVLNDAIWATLSHVGNNMLDMDSELNPNELQNAGANCSVPTGCTSARLTFVIVSGNEVLIKGTETIFR